MKTLLIQGAIVVFLGLAVGSMSAQTQGTSSSSTSYIETSKFIGKKVKSSQGDEIGTVKDIVLDRNTGCLAYTVVSTTGGGTQTSGGGGTQVSGGGKMVAVPWAVYSPSSDLNVLTVTVDRERIYNAPVFDYARIEEYSRPDFISNVYSYYGVSGSAAVGVGVSGSTTTGTTTNTGTTTTTGATTGGAARAGASAPPRGNASSPAQASPGAQGSPAPRGTAPRSTPSRTHPTASPSTRGEERSTPPTRKRGEGGRSEESSPPGGRGDTESRSENERSQPERSRQREGDTGTRESHPDSERSGADQSKAGEKTSGTRHRENTGKRESSSPPEQPEQ